jgi:hypothetical protein
MYSVDNSYVIISCQLHSVFSTFVYCILITSWTQENSEWLKTYTTNLTHGPYPNSLTFFVNVNTF